jgi:hypothetical protein
MPISLGQRLADFASMFIMGVFSLGLLAYVGFGESSNKYPQFEVDKVTAQARAVQSTMEKYLNAGLPLRQFAGFDTLVMPIIKIDDAIDGMRVADRQGRMIFEAVQPDSTLTEVSELVDPDLVDVKVTVEASYTQVILPLRSRFGFGGQLVTYVPNAYVKGQISNGHRRVEVKALGVRTAGRFDELDLLVLLKPFGDRIHPEAPGKIGNRADNCGRLHIVRNVDDEGAINLDPGKGQLPQITKR